MTVRIPADRCTEVVDDLEEVFGLDVERVGLRRAQGLYWIHALNILLLGVGTSESPYAYSTAGPLAMYKNYLKIALRTIRKHKGYALINTTGLAVGMACCLLILLFIQNELSYDRFHAHADRIYRVNNEVYLASDTPDHWTYSASPFGPTLQEDFPEVQAFVRTSNRRGQRIQVGDRVAYEDAVLFADSTFLEVFSFPLLHGDSTTALDTPFSIALTEAAAQRYFGDANPVGQVLQMGQLDDVRDYTVTGVLAPLPATSRFSFDFLVSLSSYHAIMDPRFSTHWRALGNETYILLHSADQADALNAKLPAFIKKHAGEEIWYTPYLQPLTDVHLGLLGLGVQPNSDVRYLYIFAAIALFILAIACINYMNLATARAARRAKEVGVRKVLGAYRLQLVQQFLSEALLLSLVGFFGALVVLHIAMPVFNNLLDTSLALDLTTSAEVWLALLLLSLLVGILAGGYPAFVLSRYAPAGILRGNANSPGGGSKLRRVLVVTQFGISIILLIATTIIYDQLEYVRTKNLGFAQEHVVILELRDPTIRGQYATLKQQLLAHPNVLATTAASRFPGQNPGRNGVRPQGAEEGQMMAVTAIDPAYVPTMELQLLAGRNFSDDFGTDGQTTFILNASAAATFGWTPEESIGKELARNQYKGYVVGVVSDYHFVSLHQTIEPLVLTYDAREFFQLGLRVRGENMRETLAFVEETWATLAPDLPLTYTFLDDRVAQLYTAEQKLGQLFGLFAGLAIVIACMGLFGLASFMAEQRTKEIGIRKVLGATVQGIVFLLTKEFAKLVLVAFVLAVPIAYFAMHQWLADFAYQTSISATTFVLAGVAAFLVAWLTVSYQSIRAALGNPIDALRYE